MKIAAFKGAKWDRKAHEDRKAAAAAEKAEIKALRDDVEKIKKTKENGK